MGIVSSSAFRFNLDWNEVNSQKEAKFDVGKNDEDGFVKLIVGLGNAGKKYERTRHNIGFEIINKYASENGFPEFKENKKFFGLLSEKFVNGKKIILLKPTTMMNLSGKSVAAVANFYNIQPDDITVVHDELDLDFGACKHRKPSQATGRSSHNGIKDIVKSIGTAGFKRVRFGINNEIAKLVKAEDFVLGRFSGEELAVLEKLMIEAITLIR